MFNHSLDMDKALSEGSKSFVNCISSTLASQISTQHTSADVILLSTKQGLGFDAGSDNQTSLGQRDALPRDIDTPSQDSASDDPIRPEQEPQASSVRLSLFTSYSSRLIKYRNPKHS